MYLLNVSFNVSFDVSIHGKVCHHGFLRTQKEPSSEVLQVPSPPRYCNGIPLYLLHPRYKWIFGIYMRYIASFYVRCRDFKGLWHTTVLKYTSRKTMMMGVQLEACTLENAWRFCKTRMANNSWSSIGSPGMRTMGSTRFPMYPRLNWPQTHTQNHTAPCPLRPF